jgi:glyoxylase-like metal-dependent hydrolase (beta-lactamase superfamily II)
VNEGKLFSIVYSAADMLAGYDKLNKLAEGRAEMVVPGHDQEVMNRFPASAPGLQGWAVRLDWSNRAVPYLVRVRRERQGKGREATLVAAVS